MSVSPQKLQGQPWRTLPEQGISTSSLTQHVEANIERNNQILYQTARLMSYIKALTTSLCSCSYSSPSQLLMCSCVSFHYCYLCFCSVVAQLIRFSKTSAYSLPPFLISSFHDFSNCSPLGVLLFKLDLLFDFRKYPWRSSTHAGNISSTLTLWLKILFPVKTLFAFSHLMDRDKNIRSCGSCNQLSSSLAKRAVWTAD